MKKLSVTATLALCAPLPRRNCVSGQRAEATHGLRADVSNPRKVF